MAGTGEGEAAARRPRLLREALAVQEMSGEVKPVRWEAFWRWRSKASR